VVESDDLAVAPGNAGGRTFDDELIAEVSSHGHHRSSKTSDPNVSRTACLPQGTTGLIPGPTGPVQIGITRGACETPRTGSEKE
jgi:hypothetical protein